MSFRSEQDPGANMMRGIYLAVASIIPTGMYGMANWHAAEGVSRKFITGENCRCRDGELTAGHKWPGFRAIMVTGMDVTAAKSKTRSVGPSAGEVAPSDPEFRERLEILPVGAGDRVFSSSSDSKAT
jgi:hypothetical protein